MAIEQILDAVIAQPSGETAPRPAKRDEIAAAKAQSRAHFNANGTDDSFPLRPQRILHDLRANIPDDTVLVTDVGWNKNGVAQSYSLPPSGEFITPGGLSTMGFGPAAALGVQLAEPERTVVALVGDGGMSAQLQAIPTAVERNLPVIWLVMNNRAHGTIADLQVSHYGHSYGCLFLDRDGKPYSPDFAGIAIACGADGYRVNAPGELATALKTAVARASALRHRRTHG